MRGGLERRVVLLRHGRRLIQLTGSNRHNLRGGPTSHGSICSRRGEREGREEESFVTHSLDAHGNLASCYLFSTKTSFIFTIQLYPIFSNGNFFAVETTGFAKIKVGM